MSDSILKTYNLSVGYQKSNPVLTDINLELKKGQITLLYGANGVGKSTFYRTLLGWVEPIKGSVEIMGLTDTKDVSKYISYVESNNIVANVSVKDLLGFARIPYQSWWPTLKKQDHDIIDAVAEQFEISYLQDRQVSELSQGQYQLVQIARAMVQETPIIILDEPTAHLDIVNKMKVFECLRLLASEGKTIMIKSHDIALSFPVAYRLCWVNSSGEFHQGDCEGLSSDTIIKDLF